MSCERRSEAAKRYKVEKSLADGVTEMQAESQVIDGDGRQLKLSLGNATAETGTGLGNVIFWG